MIEVLLIITLVLLIVLIFLVLLQKNNFDQTLRTENRANRQEMSQAIVNLTLQVENKLTHLQKDNNLQLEKVRETVDEKLQGTLEKRLGESFQQVSRQLEKVHQGLGEMQTLASGVGDLKKVLTNVKTRGTWGEVQLGSLLEQILNSHQFKTNTPTKKGSADRVEFAIILPSPDNGSHDSGGGSGAAEVLLPIDAKFPLEDYQRLLTAQEAVNLPEIELAKKALINRVKLEAKTIADKYLDPPQTTDYAFLYLPIEGLFAEVVQQPNLVEKIQAQYRVTIAGPTTILAMLNSLQMVMRTVAIQKQSGQVWQLLESVKTEFGTFGGILDKTQKKLQEASNQIELASKKSTTISRRLSQVTSGSGSSGGGEGKLSGDKKLLD